MTAQGKINASKVQTNDRILVHVADNGNVTISSTKTGEGVQVARVIHKVYVSGSARHPGYYTIVTNAGSFTAAPIQTMWLAPEDNAGVKRAHVIALIENSTRPSVTPWTEITEDETPAAETTTYFPGKAEGRSTEDFLASLDETQDGTVAPQGGETLVSTIEPTTTGVVLAVRPGGMVDIRWTRENGERGEDYPTAAEFADSWTITGHVLPEETPAAEALTLHSQAGKVDNMNETSATETQTAPAGNHTGSTVVSLLEKVWARIRADHPELPEVVIITGSGMIGASKWGHFRADGWKATDGQRHELFLAGEALAKGATQVLQTMLHEGAHTLARVREVKDTSRQGRWHNQAFKTLAAEMGLEHKGETADKTNGYSFVTLTASTKARYADLLAELDTEIRLTCHLPGWLGGSDEDQGGEKITGKPAGEDDGKPKSGNLKATCQCDEPVIIRLSQKVLDLGVVQCTDCDSLFTAAS